MYHGLSLPTQSAHKTGKQILTDRGEGWRRRVGWETRGSIHSLWDDAVFIPYEMTFPNSWNLTIFKMRVAFILSLPKNLYGWCNVLPGIGVEDIMLWYNLRDSFLWTLLYLRTHNKRESKQHVVRCSEGREIGGSLQSTPSDVLGAGKGLRQNVAIPRYRKRLISPTRQIAWLL